jgi:hypothetical protein
MVLARIGPMTETAESLAAAVAAGILLGGFALGSVGLLAGRSREELHARALTDGYAGGAVGVGFALVDFVLDQI